MGLHRSLCGYLCVRVPGRGGHRRSWGGPSTKLVRRGFLLEHRRFVDIPHLPLTLAWPRSALGAAACKGASFCTATLRSYRSDSA